MNCCDLFTEFSEYIEHVSQSNKNKTFENFYKTNVPKIVDVLPLDVVKRRGSENHLISRKENNVRLLLKSKSMCEKCKQPANHDSRNCKIRLQIKSKNEFWCCGFPLLSLHYLATQIALFIDS